MLLLFCQCPYFIWRIRIIRLYKQWTTHRGLCTPFDYKSFFVCFFTDIGEDAGLEIDWPARLARFPVSLSSSLSVAMQFLHLYSIYAARRVYTTVLLFIDHQTSPYIRRFSTWLSTDGSETIDQWSYRLLHFPFFFFFFGEGRDVGQSCWADRLRYFIWLKKFSW